MIKRNLILIATLFLVISAFGQNKFPNTLFYNDSDGSPYADLSAVEWVQGHWRGEAFGGVTEEIWTPALGGSMMCAFKLVVNEQVKFYELVTLAEENGTLILRLKHFHGNLKGWEEKDETVDFKLVKVTPNKVYFDGFTFERLPNDELNIYVVIENGNEKNEMKFHYQRVKN
jgi:hypothetical protein